MEQIGYSLIDKNNLEVKFWGDVKGVLQSIPSFITLPNGDGVHGIKINEQIQEWKLVNRWIVDNPPSKFHREINRSVEFVDDKIVVTTAYEDSPSIVPQTVTARQARIALLNVDLLDQVETAVNQIGGASKITWEYAIEVNRNDQLVNQLGISLGLTNQQIDDLFRQASLI